MLSCHCHLYAMSYGNAYILHMADASLTMSITDSHRESAKDCDWMVLDYNQLLSGSSNN